MSTGIISCVVVDDDQVSLHVVEKLIAQTPSLKLESSFTNPIEATHYLREHPVDVIFLDIEMPQLNGFEMISLLDYTPAIIIMTAKKEYALQAFDYEVHDFLMKPITDYSRFLKAVNGLHKIDQRTGDSDPWNFFVKSDSLLHNILIDDILFIEAFGDYVKIHTVQKVLMVLSTLKAIESKVPPDRFVRVHRSYIINVKRIENIDPNNLQIGNKVIPVSPNFRENLLKKINLL
ncbi:MAG: response regulator transcription factor [Cyclobacteriaceae bacterium]|nr:response regulator transcription factor [Cyclobacteriaceae bacterium]